MFSTSADFRCRVSQGSFLSSLIFLVYNNDKPHNVDCDLFLYADNTCLEQIKEEIAKNVFDVYNSFEDDKLSIHFAKYKILSFSQPRTKKKRKLKNEISNMVALTQNSKETYFGCEINKNLPGEGMAFKLINPLHASVALI